MGAGRVWGFCDDWKLDLDANSSLAPVVALIREFEIVSGQVINKAKTAWLPNKELTDIEALQLRQFWPQPRIVQKHKSLGFWFGPAATLSDLLQEPIAKLRQRLTDLRQHRMSLPTRILAWNVFALPLLSYISKYVLLEGRALVQVRALAMNFFERVQCFVIQRRCSKLWWKRETRSSTM